MKHLKFHPKAILTKVISLLVAETFLCTSMLPAWAMPSPPYSHLRPSASDGANRGDLVRDLHGLDKAGLEGQKGNLSALDGGKKQLTKILDEIFTGEWQLSRVRNNFKHARDNKEYKHFFGEDTQVLFDRGEKGTELHEFIFPDELPRNKHRGRLVKYLLISINNFAVARGAEKIFLRKKDKDLIESVIIDEIVEKMKKTRGLKGNAITKYRNSLKKKIEREWGHRLLPAGQSRPDLALPRSEKEPKKANILEEFLYRGTSLESAVFEHGSTSLKGNVAETSIVDFPLLALYQQTRFLLGHAAQRGSNNIFFGLNNTEFDERLRQVKGKKKGLIEVFPVEYKDGKYYIGVDIGATDIKSVVLHNGAVLDDSELKKPTPGEIDELLNKVKDILREQRNRLPEGEDLNGIGIGAPGPVWNRQIFLGLGYRKEGAERYEKMREEISKEYPGVDVIVINDGDVEGFGYLAQKLLDAKDDKQREEAKRESRNTFFLRLGTSLAGAYLNRSGLLDGMNEVGRMAVNLGENAEPHRKTGVRGALRMYVSGEEGIARMLKERGFGPSTSKELDGILNGKKTPPQMAESRKKIKDISALEEEKKEKEKRKEELKSALTSESDAREKEKLNKELQAIEKRLEFILEGLAELERRGNTLNDIFMELKGILAGQKPAQNTITKITNDLHNRYINGSSVAKKLIEEAGFGPQSIDINDLLDSKRGTTNEQKEARKIMDVVISHLVEAIRELHRIYEMDRVYLGGGVVQDKTTVILHKETQAKLNVEMKNRAPTIETAKKKAFSGAVGAALLASQRRQHKEKIREAAKEVLLAKEWTLENFLRLGETEEARAEAAKLVDLFLESVAILVERYEDPWEGSKEFKKYLQKKFGAQKIIIAAGKGSRFSPTGLLPKQLALPEGFPGNTNVKLARAAASFGMSDEKSKDIVVVDPEVANHLLQEKKIEGDRVKEDILGYLRSHFESWIGMLKEELTDRQKETLDRRKGDLQEIILQIVQDKLIYAYRPDRRNDVAEVLDEIRLEIEKVMKRVIRGEKKREGFVNTLFSEVSYAIVKPLIEAGGHMKATDHYLDEAKRDKLLGGRSIVVLARPYGPGEALREGLEVWKQLVDAGDLSESKFIMPVYSDYSAAILKQYSNIYFKTYLQAISLDNPTIDQLPRLTITGKPTETIEDKGFILIGNGGIPEIIREWRERKPGEEERFKEQERQLVNAGVFVVEGVWALEAVRRFWNDVEKEEAKDGAKKGELRWDRPDQKKGKLHEFFYTDFVEMAREKEEKERREDPDLRPTRKLVFLGKETPSGTKDLGRLLSLRGKLNEQNIETLRRLGVAVKVGTSVSLSGPPWALDLEKDLEKMFGGHEGVVLDGVIHLDNTVEIGNNVELSGNIDLLGNTKIEDGVKLEGLERKIELQDTEVGKGVILKDVTAVRTKFIENPLTNADIGRGAVKQYMEEREARFGRFTAVGSTFEDSYVEGLARIIFSEAKNSFVSGVVAYSKISQEVVVEDEELWGRDEEDRVRELSPYLKDPAHYVPGYFRLSEAPSGNQEKLKKFIAGALSGKLHSLLYGNNTGPGLYERVFREQTEDLGKIIQETKDFFEHEITSFLTSDQIWRYAFAKIRAYTSHRPKKMPEDPFREEKRLIKDPLRRYVQEHYLGPNGRISSLLERNGDSVPDNKETRALFQELALLVAKMNIFGLSSISKDVFMQGGAFGDNGVAEVQNVLDKGIAGLEPAFEEDLKKFEELVFGKKSGHFLYIVDNIGELEVDAALWLFLALLGHKVTVVTKNLPAWADAYLYDVEEVIRSNDRLAELYGEKDKDKRKIEVITNGGTNAFGVLLDRVGEPFREAFTEKALHDIPAHFQDAKTAIKFAPGRMKLHREGDLSGYREVSYEEMVHLNITPGRWTRLFVKAENDDQKKRNLEKIFGISKERPRVDQIHLSGDIYLSGSVRIENGVHLGPFPWRERYDQRIVLRGETHVGKGARLERIEADDTTFEGAPDLDALSPARETEISDAKIKDSYIYFGA